MALRLTCLVTWLIDWYGFFFTKSSSAEWIAKEMSRDVQARLQLLGCGHFDVFLDGDSVSGVLPIRQKSRLS